MGTRCYFSLKKCFQMTIFGSLFAVVAAQNDHLIFDDNLAGIWNHLPSCRSKMDRSDRSDSTDLVSLSTRSMVCPMKKMLSK